MKRRLTGFFLSAFTLVLFASQCEAKDPAAQAFKLHERYTLSLELEFSRKNPNALDRVMTFLDWAPMATLPVSWSVTGW